MAELSDAVDRDGEVKERLRLSINWTKIQTHERTTIDLASEFQVGLFLGDRPLFCDAAYSHEASNPQQTLDAYFHGESDEGRLLLDLLSVLKTVERVVIEDIHEPWCKIVIGEDIFGQRPGRSAADESPRTFQVAVVIQHGGPWDRYPRGGASGPAMIIEVTRADLEKFFRDLLREALDPTVSDDESRARLKELFKEELG